MCVSSWAIPVPKSRDVMTVCGAACTLADMMGTKSLTARKVRRYVRKMYGARCVSNKPLLWWQNYRSGFRSTVRGVTTVCGASCKVADVMATRSLAAHKVCRYVRKLRGVSCVCKLFCCVAPLLIRVPSAYPEIGE